MNSKALKTLEFDKIASMLAELCQTDASKAKALRLEPYSDVTAASRALQQTTEAKKLSGIKGMPSFGNIVDVREIAERAEKSAILTPRELLDVAKVLRVSRGLLDYIRGERDFRTSVEDIFERLMPNRELEEKITRAIIAEDMIADEASPALADIRRKMRNINIKINETLQKYVSGSSISKYLQENIVTTRGGRFVIPVKSEYKNEVKGLVHDVSSSGATLFIEPAAIVDANNELKTLESLEKHEIERILSDLSSYVASSSDSLCLDFLNITELAFIFAKAALSYRLDAEEPIISEKREINLIKARHPLLNVEKVVPITVSLGGEYSLLVITGPNTGGKTVTLKTLGLFSAMAQAGLHIPCESGSSVCIFDEIYSDIGDEQSIEQSLSTFSSHMVGIVNIIEKMTDRSLVLFDELGAGTDPVEGAALAVSIIEAARGKGAVIAATTHYAELKVYALNNEKVQNASCEFDVETLSPTYHIVMGLPGKSNAFAIARKLGLDDAVIDDAEARVASSEKSFEDTISRLNDIRMRLESEKTEISQKLRQITENEKKSARLRAELEVKMEKSDLKARREAQRIIDEARITAEEVFAELDEIRKRSDEEQEIDAINRERNILRAKLNKAVDAVSVPADHTDTEEAVSARPVKAGDTVLIKSMKKKAEVLSVSKDGTLQLRAGIININASQDDVLLLEEEMPQKKPSAVSTGNTLRSETLSASIDLRGMESAEAVYVAEQYLDNAVLAKLEKVTIIHGKGTGALRTAIHAMLKKNKLVKSFRLGVFGEGETGVTIVELK